MTVTNTKFKNNKTCTICGKDYISKKTPKPEAWGGGFWIVEIPQCTCEADIDVKNKSEIRAKEEADYKRKILQEKFKNAQIPPIYFGLELNSDYFTDIRKDEPKAFAEMQWWSDSFRPETAKGIIIVGDIGRSKSSIIGAIANNIIKKGYNCLFTTFGDLLDDFASAAKNDASINKLLYWLCEFDCIILDDLGHETYNTSKRMELAFRIVDTLFKNKKCVLVTAQKDKIEALKGNRSLDMLRDRLHTMCPHSYFFEGLSYRRKK